MWQACHRFYSFILIFLFGDGLCTLSPFPGRSNIPSISANFFLLSNEWRDDRQEIVLYYFAAVDCNIAVKFSSTTVSPTDHVRSSAVGADSCCNYRSCNRYKVVIRGLNWERLLILIYTLFHCVMVARQERRPPSWSFDLSEHRCKIYAPFWVESECITSLSWQSWNWLRLIIHISRIQSYHFPRNDS